MKSIQIPGPTNNRLTGKKQHYGQNQAGHFNGVDQPTLSNPLIFNNFRASAFPFFATLFWLAFASSGWAFGNSANHFHSIPPETIMVNAGVDEPICLGDTVQLLVTGAASYEWSPATGLSCTNCPNPLAFPTTTTTYIVTGNDGTTDTVVVSVFTQPVISSVTSSDPTDCDLPNGTIVVEATGSPALEYSINGGTIWQADGIFTALSAGSYSVMVRNANGTCDPVAGGNVTLTAPTPPIISNVIKTDPTLCDTPNGSIVIVASGGTGLQYSNDGGITWQAQNTFQLLGAGLYDIVVRKSDGTCEVSGGTVTLTGSSNEAFITDIFVANPSNCNLSDGLVTVLISNDDGNFEYSINGGLSYQTGNAFTGLGEGIYHVIVRRTDGTCITSGGFVELISTNHPTIFGTSSVDPSGCGSADGNITVLAFGPSSLQFSIDGGATWQGSNIFSGLNGGTYTIVVRNDDGSCVTNGGTVTLDAPAEPMISGVSFADPSSCGLSDGSITISATGAGTLEYSINNGTSWAASGNFTGLADGSFSIVVRYADGSCAVSYGLNPVVLASPGDAPVIQNVVTNNPSNCATNNGVIVINATGTGTLLYSIDGGTTTQTGNAFANLAAGTYPLFVITAGSTCPTTSSSTLDPAGCLDTVQLNIPANTTTEVCLDPVVFEIPGPLSSATFCSQGNAATVLATILNDACITYVPATGYSGTSPDLICVVHCFNGSVSQCDTTYIQVTVDGIIPPNCDEVFLQDTIVVPFTANPTPVCVPLSPLNANSYDVTLNGDDVTSFFGCDFDSVLVYTYAFLVGGGFNGPYTLDAWTINGTVFTGFFANVTELVDLMNTFDPSGNWQINSQTSIIFGGNLSQTYGDIMLTHVPSGAESIQMTNFSIIPNGFIVNLTSPELYTLIVTDPDTGCADTLYINASDFMPPTTEIIHLTTTVNTPTDQVCVNGSELPGGTIFSIGYCQEPTNGGSPIVNDTCVFYVPNLNFAGFDTLCVVVCDDAFPNTVCDTTLIYITVLPETDTISLTIPAGVASVDTCLSNFIIELPGPITQAAFCDINPAQINGSANDNCLTFSPVGGFSGNTQICVVHCSGTVCDTTIVLLNVVPPVVCDDVFVENSLTFTVFSDSANLCIPVPIGDIGGYTVSVDGAVYSQSYVPCGSADFVSYNYSTLPAAPYFIEEWTVNGSTFFGFAPTLSAILDSLNAWDATGIWQNNLAGQTFFGGDNSSTYGNLVVSQVGGSTFTLTPEIMVGTTGSQIPIEGFGQHEVIVVAPNGCADTVTVILEQHFITTETIVVETDQDTPIGGICVNTSELLGNFIGLNFCALPANGGIVMENDTCLQYTPGLGFTGQDEFCMLVCDNGFPQICDTFFVQITVNPVVIQPQIDTVFITADNTSPFDTCLNLSVLQLPGFVTSANVCGANATEVTLILTNNCVTIDLNDAFSGTTTACVVHCDNSNPQVCDTTILVITYDPIIVVPPTIDTVFITASNTSPFDTCLTASVLQLPGTIATANICGANASEVAFTLAANCVTIDLNDAFSGTTTACVVHCDNSNPQVCDTTILVITYDPVIVVPPTIDTVFITASSTSPFDTCLTASVLQLPGTISTANICGANASEVALTLAANCVTIDLNDAFVGTTTACVVHCDNSNPAVCDTTILVITYDPVIVVPPTIDTVFITATSTSPFDTCLTASVLQLPGTIATANICGANASEVALTLAANCVTIDLNDAFVGTTTACVVHCDNSNPQVCDTTILVITFDPTVPCPDILSGPVIVPLDGGTGEICIPISPMDIFGYDIFLDGSLYNNTLNGCEIDSVYTYFYGLVFAQGNQGPYSVSWQANGNTFSSASVANMPALVALMNSWDPLGDWVLQPATFTISSSNDSGVYGSLTVTHTASGIISNLQADFNGFPSGTEIIVTGPGQHEFVLTDPATGCSDTLIINAVNSADVLQITTVENQPSDIVCLDTTGLPGNFVAMTICGQPQNGMLIINGNCFTFNPNNGFVGNDQGCLVVCDDTGFCDTTYLQITVTPVCALFDFFPSGLQQIDVADCADIAAYCVPVLLDSLTHFSVTDNGLLYSGGFAACNGGFSQINLDTGFHQIIFMHLNTGCEDTLLVNVSCQPDTTSNCGIQALSPLTMQAVDCDSTAQFCVDVQIFELPNFAITEGGTAFLGSIVPCDTNNLYLSVELAVGLHELVFTDTVKGCSDTFLVTVNCFTLTDITIDTLVQLSDSLTLCLADYGVDITQIDSITNTCASLGNVDFDLNDTTWCISLVALSIGEDSTCYKVFVGDTCFSVFVNAVVTVPCPVYFTTDTVAVGTDCALNAGFVCLPVSLDEIVGKTIEVDGQVYTDTLIPCNFDSVFILNYGLLPSMGLIGPYIVESWSINGDVFTGVFNSAQELTDSMNLWDILGTWQLVFDPGTNTTLIMGGHSANTYGSMTVTQDLTGEQQILGINVTFVPTGVGIVLPIGTYSVSINDTLTLCSDEATVIVSCAVSEVVVDTVMVGQSDTFCLDLSDLLGGLSSVNNVCPGSLGEVVVFEILDSCIVYTGLEIGNDTACIVACDNFGLCDTTFIYITVTSPDIELPIAVNDTVVTGQGQVILIEVFVNDTVTLLNDFYFVDGPNHGNALFLPSGLINYVPDVDYCDQNVPDSFTYAICNPVGCDTATVYVSILCDEMEIFTGFSPNGDGINDFFKINGLQDYPNHHLMVFNRWGEMVLDIRDYQSDWEGTWNGKMLPDGTYFYMLDLGEGDGPLSGYVQLMR